MRPAPSKHAPIPSRLFRRVQLEHKPDQSMRLDQLRTQTSTAQRVTQTVFSCLPTLTPVGVSDPQQVVLNAMSETARDVESTRR